MKERIEIEDDRVKLMRLTPGGDWATELELPLQSFFEFLAAEVPQLWDNQPLLPPGCRWYGHRQRAEVLIVEEPPATRLIRFAAHTRKMGDEAPEEFHEMAFPYVIFAFFFLEKSFEEMKAFYRPAPLASMKDSLYLCNLFNVQLSKGHRAHNRACLRPKPDVRGLPLHEKVERLVSHFWNTEFNLDIEDNGFAFYSSRNPELATLLDWEAKSRSDPFFVLRFPWEPAGMTLAELVKSLIHQLPGDHRLPYSSRNLGDLCYALEASLSARPEFNHREGVWRK